MTVKEMLNQFLLGLGTDDKDRLKGSLIKAFDDYVPDMPGWDKVERPVVHEGINNAVDDWCK